MIDYSWSEAFLLGVWYPYTSPVGDFLVAILGCGLLLAGFGLRWIALGGGLFLTGHLFAQWALGIFLGEVLWAQAALISNTLFLSGIITAGWAALFPGYGRFVALVVTAATGTLIGCLSISAMDQLVIQIMMMGGAAISACLGVVALSFAGHWSLASDRPDWVSIGWRVISGWVTAVSCVMLALYLTL